MTTDSPPRLTYAAWRALFDLADLGDDRWRTNYVGRGAYGRECLTVVGNVATFASVVATVVERHAVASTLDDDDALRLGDVTLTIDELERLRDAVVSNTRTDDLGLDTVYYWPTLRVADERAEKT